MQCYVVLMTLIPVMTLIRDSRVNTEPSVPPTNGDNDHQSIKRLFAKIHSSHKQLMLKFYILLKHCKFSFFHTLHSIFVKICKEVIYKTECACQYLQVIQKIFETSACKIQSNSTSGHFAFIRDQFLYKGKLLAYYLNKTCLQGHIRYQEIVQVYQTKDQLLSDSSLL